MALTPEDVVNKRFQPTKFREGYDQDEVDDFLDEVVVELRRLNQENEELRQRMIGSESRISELQRGGQSGAVAPEPAAEAVAPEPEPTPEPEPVVAPAAVVAPAPTYSAPTGDLDPNNTNNLLQLARRLHEEHVKEGIEKRDALIAEGQSTSERVISEADAKAQTVTSEAEAAAERLVAEAEAKAESLVSEADATAQRVQSEAEAGAGRVVSDADATAERVVAEAEATATRLVNEAEATQRAQIAQLDKERAVLENRIDELRTFEREYRVKLKGYIEAQLRDLDASGGKPADAESVSHGSVQGGN